MNVDLPNLGNQLVEAFKIDIEERLPLRSIPESLQNWPDIDFAYSTLVNLNFKEASLSEVFDVFDAIAPEVERDFWEVFPRIMFVVCKNWQDPASLNLYEQCMGPLQSREIQTQITKKLNHEQKDIIVKIVSTIENAENPNFLAHDTRMLEKLFRRL